MSALTSKEWDTLEHAIAVLRTAESPYAEKLNSLVDRLSDQVFAEGRWILDDGRESTRFSAAVAERIMAERQACAQVADAFAENAASGPRNRKMNGVDYGREIALAIRTRTVGSGVRKTSKKETK